MNTDHDELLDLAEMLDRKAKWSDARAALAAHDATINPQKEVTNASYCRRKAEVCRRAAEKMAAPKPPRNKALANAPALGDWIAYAVELKWPTPDATACWDHFQSCGWRIGGKALVKDWKAAARNGHRRWLKEHPTSAKIDTGFNPNPKAWSEFLKKAGMTFREPKTAQPYLQREFNNSEFNDSRK